MIPSAIIISPSAFDRFEASLRDLLDGFRPRSMPSVDAILVDLDAVAARRPPWPEERAPIHGPHVPRLHVSATLPRALVRYRRPHARGQGTR